MTFGGRLTLASGKPVIDADTTSETLFYTHDTGNEAGEFTFTAELSISLAGLAGGSVHKVFIGTGGLYLGSPVGSRAYGTGYSGTGSYPGHDTDPPLSRVNGVQVNSAGDPYLGSILIDPAGGTCTAHVTQGGKRLWGVWNRYNQRTILLKAGVDGLGIYEPAATQPAWAPLHNNPDNCLTFVTGEPQQIEASLLTTRGVLAGGNSSHPSGHYQCAIALNRTDGPDGQYSALTFELGALPTSILNSMSDTAPYVSPPLIGANTLYAIENHRFDTNVVYGGNIQTMLWARLMG